ncbi:MAG: hypothetical protein ACLS63_09185 [Flavonifractor plautii]
MAFRIWTDGMEPAVAAVITAIGHHDDPTASRQSGCRADPGRQDRCARSRCATRNIRADIHDRVNYAAERPS